MSNNRICNLKKLLFSVIFIMFHVNTIIAQSQEFIEGTVTYKNNPISGAIVKWQASSKQVLTDSNGFFQLSTTGKSTSDIITAAKPGFYTDGILYKSELRKVKFNLIKLPLEDNLAYKFINPSLSKTDKDRNCVLCHSYIYKQWKNSAHSSSATNPVFLNLYNGTNSKGDVNIQPGFKLDYQFSNGNCGNCHAPLMALDNFNNADMNNLNEVEKFGVSCDFCHKVKDVKMQENSNLFTGVMNYLIIRPPDNHQVFWGPFADVKKPYAYSEIISQSIFCAPCHQGGAWGIPIYDSYDQWLKSPYAEEGIACQDCHMKPDGVTSNIAPGKGGITRDPNTIFSHQLFGSKDSSFLVSAVKMEVKYKKRQDRIIVDVEIENSGAGHHIPTDQPMRNIILVVRAFDSSGHELKYNGDNLIPFWGGRGSIKEGNYEGYPGKGYAKILFEDWTRYERIRVYPKNQQIFPAPQWRTVQIKTDTRIPARQKDKTSYEFIVDKNSETYFVECKLIYRRTFKTWAKMKNWKLKDIIIAEKRVKINK